MHRNFRPALVLLDMNLPDLSGDAVAAEIREQPGGGKVSIVAITGWQRSYDYHQLDKVRFDGNLRKPVPVNLLAPYLPKLPDRVGSESG